MSTDKPANFPVVTNEVIVHREGPLIELAQLLADGNCRRVPLDAAVGILATRLHVAIDTPPTDDHG